MFLEAVRAVFLFSGNLSQMDILYFIAMMKDGKLNRKISGERND